MLGGKHDLGRFDRLAIGIAQGHLAFGVGTEGLFLAGFARRGQQLQNLVAVMERRRHQGRGLAAGITEHDALIARAFILVAAGVHALGDVRRLGMQQDFDLGLFPVKTILLVADILDRGARHGFDLRPCRRIWARGFRPR